MKKANNALYQLTSQLRKRKDICIYIDIVYSIKKDYIGQDT